MLISIEGNIGTGKTTLLKSLQNNKYKSVYEPVDEWGDWLNLFYKDKRNAFGFNMKILHSYQSKLKDENIISERSPFTSKEIFYKLALKEKFSSYCEYNLYCDYYDLLARIPDYFIYIQTDPEVCLERIKNRNRKEEENISLEYLKELHKYHENVYNPKNFIVGRGSPIKNKNIIIIDGNQNRFGVLNDVRKAVNLI